MFSDCVRVTGFRERSKVFSEYKVRHSCPYVFVLYYPERLFENIFFTLANLSTFFILIIIWDKTHHNINITKGNMVENLLSDNVINEHYCFITSS